MNKLHYDLLSCFSRAQEKYHQTLFYEKLSDKDRLQLLNIMVTDDNLNIWCRQKLAEAVIEQKRLRQ